jgi:formylglycine-generating enzyme required for sulfatase activity
LFFLMICVAIIALATFIFVNSKVEQVSANPTPDLSLILAQTQTSEAQLTKTATIRPIDTPTNEPTATLTLSPTVTPTPSQMPTQPNLLDVAAQIIQTENAGTETQVALNMTATATFWTPSPTPDVIQTFAMQTLIVQQAIDTAVATLRTATQSAIETGLALSFMPTYTPTWTPTITLMPTYTPTYTPSPTPTGTLYPLELALQLAMTPFIHNEDWIPFEYELDGVVMVLVPAGSFVMGSSPEEINRAYNQCIEIYGSCERDYFEREARNGDNTQTFTQPFWIDKYEVSQVQFRQFNGEKVNSNSFTGDHLPIENITWFEAQAYCESRGGRLPTEAEWEYASRGPNGLIYPWGDNFDETHANFCDENCELDWHYVYANDGYANTAPVHNYPDGASWVGAYQMSGNVWEWTLSIYDRYPYNTSNENTNSNNLRVIRGGSWGFNFVYVRSVNRNRNIPSDGYTDVSFRCMRSYNP